MTSTNPPNAILAINSLDRYITTKPTTVSSTFTATWVPSVQFLTLFSGTPLVGATISAAGIPVNAKILSISPSSYPPLNGYSIEIDAFTGGNQPIPGLVLQTYTISNATQPINDSLEAQFQTPITPPFGNDFTIQSPSALIYGYINRIIITQIQIQYNVPTVNYNLNDTFFIHANDAYYRITIPYGFYYPDELAAVLQAQLLTEIPAAEIDVKYLTRTGFEFESLSEPVTDFYFPDSAELDVIVDASDNPIMTPALKRNVLKTCKLLGITAENSVPGESIQTSAATPNFLYTPYIDFYSDVLTNYQLIKDTDTSVTKRKGLLARLYLSGSNTVQTTTAVAPGTLGSAPFTVTADLNTPKVIRWTPQVAVPSIDFQLRDCYGDLLPGFPNSQPPAYTQNGSEFQMTLLCIEGKEEY